MMIPWSAQQHASMHWRPDAVTRSSIIEPFFVRQVSPVDMARHTIDPFIASVRGAGPAVSPYPSPEDIAYAAGKLAKEFRQGRCAILTLGTSRIKVSAASPSGGGIVGTIMAAAKQLATGQSVAIQVGPRKVVVCNSGPGGEPVVRPASAPQTTTNSSVQAEQKAAFGTNMPHRRLDRSRGMQPFGRPLLEEEILPKIPRPGNVPQFPYIDYGKYYHEQYRGDNTWAHRAFQAQIAQQWAPRAMINANAATKSPINYAQSVVANALNSRPEMSRLRRITPSPVFPQQVPLTLAVRPEQRR